MKSRHSLILASAITLACSASPLFAAAPVFTGASGGLWSTTANWTPNTSPVLAADTATFTNPGTTNVRLNGATATNSHITFGNGAGFTIGNASGDTANITQSTRNVIVSDAFNYSINLTNGGGSGTTSTGAYAVTSATFNIAAGGKLTLDGRYFGASGGMRTITKSTGTGTLELNGNYTTTFMQCSLSAGTLVLNGTGSNARLMGLGSIAAAGTLKIGSSNTNLFSGTVVAPATDSNTGIRLISGTVDLNGFNASTTRIQGTATTGIITNNGMADSVLTLGDFGTTTGLATTITQPVFGGIIQDGSTNKLGLTLTGGSGDKLTLTLNQAALYTGATHVENGATLFTKGLAGASPITLDTAGILIIDGPLSNSAGVTVTSGTLDVREGFSSGAFVIAGGSAKFSQAQATTLPVASLTQSGGDIVLEVVGNTADKLISAGAMNFSGGTITANLQSAPTAPVVLAEYGSLTGTPTVAFSPALSTTRLSSPVVDTITGNKVTLSLSGSAADLVWTGASSLAWDLTANNWTTGGPDAPFFNLDRVTFNDAPANKTIDLPITVTPGKMTFSSTGTNDYTLSGVGGIGGAAEGLVKNGDAWLNLGGVNTFVGPVQINDGKMVLLTPQALGYTSGLTINSSFPAAGQLDVNGQLVSDAQRSISATISGDGWDLNGAIINNSATSTIVSGNGKSGIRNLTLAANASVGGSGIFDIGTGGTIDGGGFTLTKKGAGTVQLNGPASNISTVIEAGTLSTIVDDGFGSTLKVKSGGTAGNPRTSGTYNHGTNVTVETGGTLKSNTSVNWNGNFVAEGNLTIAIDQVTSATMTFPDAVSIPGNLVSNGAASGGTISFLGNLAVTGAITMTNGTLSFDGSSGTLSAASIALNAGGSSLNFNRSSNMTFGNIISGSGGVRQLGTGTTTLNGNNTYAGTSATTSVSAGTLLVNGTQTGGANVTVSSGATLGGIGTMPAAVTVTGTLAPGGPGIGTFHCGTSTKAATINGTLKIKYDGSANPANDSLAVSGPMTLGAASAIDFDSTGSPLTSPVYQIFEHHGVDRHFRHGHRLASRIQSGAGDKCDLSDQLLLRILDRNLLPRFHRSGDHRSRRGS